MESIHKIREIVESKVDHFTDGEYLELMNALMSLSKDLAGDVVEDSSAEARPLLDLSRTRYVLIEEDDDELDVVSLLRWASEYGHVDTVRGLIDSGVDIHADDELALQRACACGHSAVVRILLEYGADLSVRENYALSLASGGGHVDVVKILLEHGADLSVGRPLQWAIVNGRSEVVRILLEFGALIDDRALQLAREYGREDIIQILSERRSFF